MNRENEERKGYTVTCKNCGKSYVSSVNRSGICPDCKRLVRGRTNTRYRDSKYDRITLYVPKGEKEKLKDYVTSHGMSMNEFLNNAVMLYGSAGDVAAELEMSTSEFVYGSLFPYFEKLLKQNENKSQGEE